MSAHDPLCPEAAKPYPWPACGFCLLILRTRQDERARWQPRNPITRTHAAFCWCEACTRQAVGPT